MTGGTYRENETYPPGIGTIHGAYATDSMGRIEFPLINHLMQTFRINTQRSGQRRLSHL